MNYFLSKTGKTFFSFLICIGMFGTMLKSESVSDLQKPLAKEYSYADIRANFLAARNSKNQDHVQKALLSTEEIAQIQKGAEAELAQRILQDKTGQLAKNSQQQIALYQELLQASYGVAIQRQVDLFAIALDLCGLNQAPAIEEPKNAAHEEHFLLDIRASKGNFNSELITVPHIIFKDHIKTLSGSAKVAHKIYNPSNNIEKIEATQRQIVWFLQHPEIMSEAQKLLSAIAELEKEWSLNWFINKINPKTNRLEFIEHMRFIVAREFFIWSDKSSALNRKNLLERTDAGLNFYYFATRELVFLGIPAIFGLVAAGLGIAALATGGNVRTGLLISFAQASLCALSFGIPLIPLFATVIWQEKHLFKKVQDSLIKIRQISELSLRLRELLPAETFSTLKTIDNFFDASHDTELAALLNNLKSPTFASKASIYSHYGRVIRTFKMFDEQKIKFGALLGAIGDIDACQAAAEVIKKPKVNNNGFCLVQLVDSPDIQFNCQGMWDVFIDPAQAIANDLSLGKTAAGSDGACGVLLSGPNYGGKSVFLRGMITTAVLAQSFGIAPAKSLKMTPMDCFDTYINVQDDTTAKESLFSAEMKRAESLLSSIENASKTNKKVFLVADELLTGTHSDYASALVRSIIEQISTFDNVICIFASHFDEVINNAKLDTNGLFKQMYVGAKTDEKGFFAGPTYKINAGVSPVNSAFFVAEQKLSKQHAKIVKRAKEIFLKEREKKQKCKG